MAAILSLSALEAFALGSSGTITALALFISSYQQLEKYLDSGKLIDLIPANDTSSRQLVTTTGVGDLTPMDGALIGTSTTGLLLLNPKFRVAGGMTLLASFITGRNRDNARVIAVTSSAVAATIANPVGAAQVAYNLEEWPRMLP